MVPLYARQAPAELVAMMKDCSPALICCGDAGLRDGIMQNWPDAPPQYLFEEYFSRRREARRSNANPELADSDPVTIIYTSGTSGEAKGVILTAGNVGHMLGCTSGGSTLVMEKQSPGRTACSTICRSVLPVLDHAAYLPSRGSLLTLNTDLSKIAGEMRTVAPDYFLNVPPLLERMRKGSGRTALEDRRHRPSIYTQSQSRLDAQAGRQVAASPILSGWLWPMPLCFPLSAKK